MRLDHRPQGKAGLIPANVFEDERPLLIELPPHLPARICCMSATRTSTATWLRREFLLGSRHAARDGQGARIRRSTPIVPGVECVAEYPLPADGVRNAQFSPPGQPAPPGNANNRKRPTQEEEKRLRTIAPSVDAYLSFALKPQGIPRHRFLRELFALSRQMTAALFVQTVERALRYRITSIETLRRIAQLSLSQGEPSCPARRWTKASAIATRTGRAT